MVQINAMRQGKPFKLNSLIPIIFLCFLVGFVLLQEEHPDGLEVVTVAAKKTKKKSKKNLPSFRSPLMYGTKDGGAQTAQLVKDAILQGFRHVVTSGHHGKNQEGAAGEGWKQAANELGLKREELFLQTCFVPWDSPDFSKQPTDPEVAPATMEEQVHLSIKTSLRNLQTDYLDAVLFHNFRADLYDFDKMQQAWKVLEAYVDKGTIRYLGFTSVHAKEHLDKIFESSQFKIKPSILQNRFHSNRGYDVKNQETFGKYKLQIQRFWLLNGSSGGGKRNQEMAEAKQLTPAQLLLAFVMSRGESCLVGTHSIQHMKDDVQMAQCYDQVFKDDEERKAYAQKLGPGDKMQLTPYHDEGTSTQSSCTLQF